MEKNLRKTDKNQGISLITLIITIVVLLILVGITINMVIGDNGIIAKSKDARDNVTQMQNETANKREDLYDEIVSGKSQYETDGDVEVSLEVTKNSETSITATAEATDTTSQIISYTFYIRKITEDDSAYVIIKKSDKLENTATISNLEKDMGYKVKVVAMDKTGTSKTATKNIALGNVVKITVKGTNGPDAYPSILSVTAKSTVAKIDYIEMPSGEKIYSTNGKYTMKTAYNSTKNGPIVFIAYDIDGNSTQLEYEETNVINFETEWTFAETNTTITVPVTGTVDVYIDYGDGTKENITTANPTHTYAETGTYTMKISGKCGTFSFNDSTRYYVTELKKWGVLQNTSYAFGNFFSGCENIVSTIPEPHKKSFANITTFKLLFAYCKALNGSIPIGIFDNCSKVTSFYYTFKHCKNLTGNIPLGLFDNCPNVTNFRGTFSECYNLTGSIPTGLFDNSPNVTNFAETFSDCEKLTGSIPEGLFDNSPYVTSFYQTFYECGSLTGEIPQGLFDNCSKVTSFCYTFCWCNNLTGSIPVGLFDNCPNVTNFGYTFKYCQKLTGSIPTGLFDNCPSVTSFEETFFDTGITEIPVGLFDNCLNVTSFYGTFYSTRITEIPVGLFDKCTKVTSFNRTFERTSLTQIPSGVFNNCMEVTNFSNTFDMCKNLTTIPEELFDNCSNVTSFYETFCGTGITEIPVGLFDNCPNVTSFYGTFCGTGITEIPVGLFDNCSNVTTFSATFSNCTDLIEIPNGLFDNCQNVVSFGYSSNTTYYKTQGTFYNCTSLTGLAPELWNRENVTSSYYCFYGCTNLENYADIPDGWK